MSDLKTLKDIEVKGQNIPTWVLQLVAREWRDGLINGKARITMGFKDAELFQKDEEGSKMARVALITWINHFFNLEGKI